MVSVVSEVACPWAPGESCCGLKNQVVHVGVMLNQYLGEMILGDLNEMFYFYSLPSFYYFSTGHNYIKK